MDYHDKIVIDCLKSLYGDEAPFNEFNRGRRMIKGKVREGCKKLPLCQRILMPCAKSSCDIP